jgi:hypothetical protein
MIENQRLLPLVLKYYLCKMNPWNWDIHYVADRRGFASDALECAPLGGVFD